MQCHGVQKQIINSKEGFGGVSLLPNNSSTVSSAWSRANFPVEEDSFMTYLVSVHWTVLALTTIGDLPRPGTKGEYLYVIFELIIGVITFATVLGYVSNIVTNVSAARKDFQCK